jgi:mRNA-degrading endonuclease RelE of RelBE toxin-antitoxin system
MTIAAQAIHHRAPALPEACAQIGTLTGVGNPRFGPLAGCHGGRRSTYRIVYRMDEASRTVHVLDIDHRSEIYHRP